MKLVFLHHWMKTLSQVSPNIQRYISNNPPCCAPPIYSSIRYWEILETREGEIQFCFWRNRVFGMFLLEAGDAGWWEAPPVGSPTPQRPQLFPPKALRKPPQSASRNSLFLFKNIGPKCGGISENVWTLLVVLDLDDLILASGSKGLNLTWPNSAPSTGHSLLEGTLKES